MKETIAALLALLCAGCATAPPPDPKAQLPALEARIFELINERRASLDPGAAPLNLDSELVGLARQRSTDMAAKNTYESTPGDPHISATRLMAEDAAFQGLLGENVAAQRYDRTKGIDIENSASALVDTWMKSQRHRENLGYADYVRTGVGAAVTSDTIFVTQLFATPFAVVKRDRAGSPPPLRGPVSTAP